MVTLTIVGVIATGRYQGSQGIKNTLKEISSAINNTRKRSVAQESGYAWGMRFVNTTSSQRYEIFRGASYALGTVQNTYPLSIRGMKFSNPFTSSTIDFAFAARTGTLSAKQAVSIVTGAGDFFMGDIVANTLGNIVTRFENGIVGYWHFDEGVATTTYDASGQGNNGTATNSPTWLSGSNCKAGGCLSFVGGSSQYVTIGDPTGGELDFGSATDFSIAGWFKRASGISGIEIIVSKRDGVASTNAGYEIGLRSTGNLYARIADGTTEVLTADDGISEADGSWHFFAVTFDRDGNVTRYVDGSAYGATIAESSVNSINNSISFKIGSRTNGISETDSPITGSIDEVRIYNRTLTAAEVLSIYNDLK
ncbi:MAG: LamG domain-containing protein [Patescibacteria group bacterium]